MGLSPLSPEKMMDAWAFLPDLLKFDINAVDTIKNLIPACSTQVAETGTLLDDKMDETFYNNGGIFSRVPNSQNDAKDTSEDAPVNHRCRKMILRLLFIRAFHWLLLQAFLLDVQCCMDAARASEARSKASS